MSFPPEGRHLLDYAPLRAAGFGLAIWTFDYLVSVGARMVVQSIGDPDLQQLAYWSFASASFLLTSLLALVRPALSLGLPHPFRAGIRMAGGNALALYLLLAAMAVPAILLRPEAELLPRIYMRSVLVADVISIALILPLNVFQYLAVEISTVLFAVAAFLRGRDEASRKAAELRLLNRLFPAAS